MDNVIKDIPIKNIPITDIENKDVAAVEGAAIQEYERVFERYLAICNEAIEKNKNNFPYCEIWKAGWKKLGDNNTLQCAVYDDRPKVIYTLKLTEDMKIKIIKKDHINADEVWPFKYSYLKHVVDHPQDYIEHPATLDWGWLTEVFG